MAEPFASAAMTSTLADNIATLRARRVEDQRRASFSDMLADRITRFAGSMTFVAIHLVFYGGWIVINLGWVPQIAPFDPTFVVLAMEASVEAIFLSTFVLISQNRMAVAADRRADLDLHINLLAEHELTQLASLVDRIARKLGVENQSPDFQEIKRDVRPETVLDAIEESGRE